MKKKPFSFRDRAASFRFAWEGIRNFFRKEHNAWIHMAASVTVIVAAWWFRLPRTEIILLVIVTGLVWVTEILNTVIEQIMDLIIPERHPEVKRIKDMAAGAVLVAALIALITGILVFIPKIF
ncbi:MAG: diacylglycerol kinase family protein [Bacteroidota bacterium]|nr:diacylglycerol kinase family protein [Bacteroidota bacterium]